MFYAYIPLFYYIDTTLGQMPAAAALRLRLRLEIPAADRGTVYTLILVSLKRLVRAFCVFVILYFYLFRL